MDEADVMNMIAALYQEFPYYHFKTLKAKTQQPEAHLRSIMEKIGVLVRDGPAANTWTLKPEFATAKNIALGGESASASQAQVAPEMASDEDDDDDMEDVI